MSFTRVSIIQFYAELKVVGCVIKTCKTGIGQLEAMHRAFSYTNKCELVFNVIFKFVLNERPLV